MSEMNRTKCLICGSIIDDPISDYNIHTFLNRGIFHFTITHARQLKEYLSIETLASVLSDDPDDLHPVYLEFYPDGDMLTAHVEIHDLLLKFVRTNTKRIPEEGRSDATEE